MNDLLLIISFMFFTTLVILIYLFMYQFKTTFKEFLIITSIALIQTTIFGIIVKISELLGLYWFVVRDFNDNYITIGELALILFIVFLISDVIGELFRKLLVKYLNLESIMFKILIISIISIIQLIILIIMLYMTSSYRIIEIVIYDENYDLVNTTSYTIILFTSIFISELIVGLISEKYLKK